MSTAREPDGWGAFCELWLDVVRHETPVTLDDGKTFWVTFDDVVSGESERTFCESACASLSIRTREALWDWLHEELDQRLYIHALTLRAIERITNER